MRCLRSPLNIPCRPAAQRPARARSAPSYRAAARGRGGETPQFFEFSTSQKAVDLFQQNQELQQQLTSQQNTYFELQNRYFTEKEQANEQLLQKDAEIERLRAGEAALEQALREEQRSSRALETERNEIRYKILQKQINLNRYNKYFSQMHRTVSLEVLASIIADFCSEATAAAQNSKLLGAVDQLAQKVEILQGKVNSHFLEQERKLQFRRSEPSINESSGRFDSVVLQKRDVEISENQ